MRKFLESLERIFRHALVYPLLKVVFHNRTFDGNIDLSSIQSILILRYDKIGDMVVTKPIFRALKRRNPRVRIGVITSASNAEIILNDPHVHQRYILSSNPFRLVQELLRARKSSYEVVLNFIFNRTTSAALIANVVAPRAIKVGQGAQKYAFYFNKMISLPRSERHMVEILSFYVSETFGITIDPEELDLFYEVDDRSHQAVNEFLRGHSLDRRHSKKGRNSYLVLNISVRDAPNAISLEQAIELARYLTTLEKFTTALIYSPEDAKTARTIEKVASSKRCLRFPNTGTATLGEVASLLQGAVCVVTPDTSIVHLASAVRTPTVAFLTPLRSNEEWSPYRVPHEIVRAEPGHPVSSIPTRKLIEGVGSFLSIVARDSELRAISR